MARRFLIARRDMVTRISSETTFDPLKWPRPIDFMIEHHLMRSSDAAKCDRIVFVYRDPVKRLVSLFKNKFIMKDGHEDLFRRYESMWRRSTGIWNGFVTRMQSQ